MTYLGVTNDIESFFANNWAHTAIAYENSPFAVPETSPWVHLQVLFNPSENAALGVECVRINGSIIVTAYDRYDNGIGDVTDLADKIATVLQNKKIDTGILTYTTDLVKAGDARRQMNRIESDWYIVVTQTRF